jgi:hypothetical protein
LQDNIKEDPKEEIPNLVCQFSSIGSMGPNETSWLGKEFINSLCPNLGINFSNKCPKNFICVNKQSF